MKYLLPLILLLANIALAETSIERAELYYSDIKSGDYLAASGHFVPDQLQDFRASMEFYKELPADSQARFVQTFFGPDHTAGSIEKFSDAEFFSGIFNFIMAQAAASGKVNFDGLEILGDVKEGKDFSHLVTRNRVTVGELEVETLEVVSLKRSGDGWRILMSGSIKGLPDQIKAAFSQQNNS